MELRGRSIYGERIKKSARLGIFARNLYLKSIIFDLAPHSTTPTDHGRLNIRSRRTRSKLTCLANAYLIRFMHYQSCPVYSCLVSFVRDLCTLPLGKVVPPQGVKVPANMMRD